MLYSKSLPVTYFIYISVYMSVPIKNSTFLCWPCLTEICGWRNRMGVLMGPEHLLRDLEAGSPCPAPLPRKGLVLRDVREKV